MRCAPPWRKVTWQTVTYRRKRKDMALKNEDRVSATRARLIDAAVNALAEIGYHRTTFVEVSRRSELSRGAIHHHFESIADLMAAVTRDISRRIQEDLTAGLQALPDDADQIDLGIDLMWKQMQQPSFRALNQIRCALATDAVLEAAVQDDVRGVWTWLQERTRRIVATGNEKSNNIDPAVISLVLSSLSGAADNGTALGPPDDDPDHSAFLGALKESVQRMSCEQSSSLSVA